MTQKIKIIKGTREEMAFMVAELHALRRLFAITFAFLLWLLIAILLFALCLLRIVPLGRILSVHQYLSFLGISPFLLTVLTWRVAEKLLDRYTRWFLRKYVQNEKL
jgi:hypothetical protein